MPEAKPFTSLFDTLTRASFLTGTAVRDELLALKASVNNEIESKFNALSQEDARVNDVLTMLLKISDAEPNTPEWDEGQNLYTLISNKYVAVADRVEANELEISDLKTMAQTMASDLATYNQAVNAKVDKEIVNRQTAVTELQEQINANKSALATANQERSEAITALNQQLANETNARTEKDEQQQAEINTLKTRVTTAEEKVAALETKQQELNSKVETNTIDISNLKVKQSDLLIRVQTLEGYFVGMGDGTAIANEAIRGLKGQASAYGHTA